MITRSVIVGSFLAFSVAVALFQLKYCVAEQERRMAKILKEIYLAEESIHILQAEWSYLNDPQRLQKLATKHLHLHPAQTLQLVKYEQVEQLYQDKKGTTNERLVHARFQKVR